VSCVAIAVLVTLVEIVRHGGPRRWLAVAPFVTALWINFHSLAFLGPCLLLWHAAIAAMERTCAGRSEDGAPAGLARDLFLAGAASSLALLANPYGIAAWTFPLTLFQRVGAERDVFARILEFARPLDDPFDPALRWFWAMLAALVASFAALGRRASVGRAAAVIPFLALALLARRNVPLFSIVAAPALAANLAALGRRATAGPAPLRALAAGGPMLAIAGLAGFAAAVLAGASPTLLGLPRERGLGLQPGLFPEDCLASLERLGAKGRLFNDLDFGGYVEWRSPDRPAFVDARLEVAGADRLAEIIAAHESPAGWERLRARWNPEILLLQHSSRGSAALLRSLLASGEWVPTCFSPEAALLVARALSPGAPVRPSADGWEEILAEARAPEPLAGRSLALVTEPLDRLLRPSPAPSAVRRAMRLANLHLTLDDPTAARGGYSAVLAVAPADPEALFNLGLCELRLGRRDEARRIWEDGLARVDRGSRAIFRRGIDELLRP
jgi:tetratricopeptide (TPR) repeat protein